MVVWSWIMVVWVVYMTLTIVWMILTMVVHWCIWVGWVIHRLGIVPIGVNLVVVVIYTSRRVSTTRTLGMAGEEGMATRQVGQVTRRSRQVRHT